ncbi:MAG TPA: hypothetical protein VHU18_09150 [Rhizomicrobium sp.]|nr:hypothetical protein [Rhizomicrobium sp.]
MALRLSGWLGILLAMACIARAFMWSGGWEYIIAGFALLTAAITSLVSGGKTLLLAAWGVFIGANLQAFIISLQVVDGDWLRPLPFMMLIAVPAGMAGLLLALKSGPLFKKVI